MVWLVSSFSELKHCANLRCLLLAMALFHGYVHCLRMY